MVKESFDIKFFILSSVLVILLCGMFYTIGYVSHKDKLLGYYLECNQSYSYQTHNLTTICQGMVCRLNITDFKIVE